MFFQSKNLIPEPSYPNQFAKSDWRFGLIETPYYALVMQNFILSRFLLRVKIFCIYFGSLFLLTRFLSALNSSMSNVIVLVE